mmetsp:Transcript_55980/g.62655  ORF Transcript_55980/g.62655 Transcript_55980/m.62655 type:complete len:103 (-) Transcript_55980:1873-2181(-)
MIDISTEYRGRDGCECEWSGRCGVEFEFDKQQQQSTTEKSRLIKYFFNHSFFSYILLSAVLVCVCVFLLLLLVGYGYRYIDNLLGCDVMCFFVLCCFPGLFV